MVKGQLKSGEQLRNSSCWAPITRKVTARRHKC